MNYKLDKEYIVNVLGHIFLPILYYRRSFYLSRTSFARGRKIAKKFINSIFFYVNFLRDFRTSAQCLLGVRLDHMGPPKS